MVIHNLTEAEKSSLVRFFIAVNNAMVECGVDSFSVNCESGNDYVRLTNGTEVDGNIIKSEHAMEFLAGASKTAQRLEI
jgi:hypothetical protein